MVSFLPPFDRLARIPLFLILPVVFVGCSLKARSPAADPGGSSVGGAAVAVHVTFRERPAEGVLVEWRRGLMGEEGPPAASGKTDASGTAEFSLPPGRYFLLASWRKDGEYRRGIAPGDRFAYFGGNPVYVAQGGVREMFVGLEEHLVPAESAGGEEKGTGAAGHVLDDGAPVAGAYVYAYLRPDSGFRDMGFAASAPTSEDGSFLLDLPPGEYYLVARRRAGGGVAGPLRKGDHFGYFPANPVRVDPGRFTRATIPATRLRLRNAPAYSGEYKAAAFIEGRILDRTGKPVAGVYAALYDNPDLLNRPVFLSDVTGEDGKYRLPVPVPGTYFLGARSGYGGSPAPGDLYGRYEGNPEHSVSVKTGDRLTGADIVVEEVW